MQDIPRPPFFKTGLVLCACVWAAAFITAARAQEKEAPPAVMPICNTIAQAKELAQLQQGGGWEKAAHAINKREEALVCGISAFTYADRTVVGNVSAGGMVYTIERVTILKGFDTRRQRWVVMLPPYIQYVPVPQPKERSI